MLKLVAVITGDIIRSSRMPGTGREQLLKHLQELFTDLGRRVSLSQSEIFRGDSFQLLLTKPEEALLAALLLKSGLRKSIFRGKEGKQQADARISIGIGTVSYEGERLSMSDGEAFRLSGRGLDEIKKRNSLSINTIWSEVNEEMEVACALSEAIIGRWTQPQATIIYAYLLNNQTQQELAEKFGITQGAVSQRLSESGHMNAIRILMQRFEKVISNRR